MADPAAANLAAVVASFVQAFERPFDVLELRLGPIEHPGVLGVCGANGRVGFESPSGFHRPDANGGRRRPRGGEAAGPPARLMRMTVRRGRTVDVTIATVNPTTGETLKTFEAYDDAELERRLTLADRAFRSYRRTSLGERAALVRGLADLLDKDRDSVAETITVEMGKPIVQARNEVAELCRRPALLRRARA